MLFGQNEHFFHCPYCFEEISVLIEAYDGKTEYVEDCEVCCNPIEFSIITSARELHYFEANKLYE